MARIEANTSLTVISSFIKRTAKGMIRTGGRAMIVDAIPILACLTAKRENETPKNGPKKAPSEEKAAPFLFFNP